MTSLKRRIFFSSMTSWPSGEHPFDPRTAGAVWVNGWAALDPALPWGGMKTSGIGRELGWSGILANTEEKVVTLVL